MNLTNPEKTMILLVGIQASGKTSFCRAYFPGLVRVSLDELHTRRKEALLIDDCLANGVSFVVDNTNPTRMDRAGYIEKAKTAGYAVLGYYFRSSITDCVDRNSRRTGKAQVPRNAVAHTHRILELPDPAEGFDRLFYVQITDGGFSVEEWKETEKENEI